MELVTVIIGGVVILVSAGVAWVIDKYIEVKKKNEEIEALRRAITQYSQTYSFEPCDEKLIKKCRTYISNKFSGTIESEFSKYHSMNERKQLASEVAQELADVMGVNLDEVTFEELGLFTRGYAISENGKTSIVLNEAFLVADPQQIIKTICHELRHCIQIQSCRNNKWGFSPQRIAQWLYSWQHYVECDSIEKYEAYQKQIIEIDALNFAEAVFNS